MEKKYLVIAFLLIIASPFLQAKSVYVADQIEVETRRGPTSGYKFGFLVKPGTSLEVLQTNQETGFVQVRDARGRTAWIDPKYLSERPTVHQKFKDAEAEISRLKAEFSQKESEMTSRINQLSPLEGVNADLQNKLAQLQSELEQSDQKAQLYEGGFKTEAFFGGAAVLLGGMFIGWLFSKFGGKRRNTGWN